jgi:hypothetical protein
MNILATTDFVQTSRRTALAALLFALAACGGGEGGDPVGTAAEDINGGSADNRDPAVVALLNAQGREECSGTLVSPGVILSAAHCASLRTAVFGNSASASRRIEIAWVVQHPKHSGAGMPYDIEALGLKTAVHDIAPVPIAYRATLHDGEPIRHVGFGDTNGSSSTRGRKRDVTYPIVAVQPYLVWSGYKAGGPQTCDGDSGGPALVKVSGVEKLVGVVSGGPDCKASGAKPGNDARVDQSDIWTWMEDWL